MAEKVVAIKIDVQGTSDQNKKLASFEKGLEELTAERRKLNAEVRKAGKITDDQAKKRAKLNTQIKATRSELNKTRNAMSGTSSFTQKLGGQFNKLGKSIGGAFIGLFAIQQLTRLVGDAFDTMKEFEQQMANVKAISGATEKEFEALQNSALELGRTTRQTALEVAQLQEEYAKLGFNTEEILAATSATIELAEATGSDLATSAKVAASTLNGFGLEADETQRIVDVMAASFTTSALDVEKFEVAMANVAPVAKEAGLSIEETTGFLGVLVNNGIQASKAGTGLRNVFLTLAKTGLSLEEAMDAINSSTDKAAAATELFGKENAVVATTIANNTDKIGEMTVELEGAAGAAADMAEITGDTLAGDVDRLASAWDGFVLSLGGSDGFLNQTARVFVNFFSDILTDLRDIEDITRSMNKNADQKTITEERSKQIAQVKELVKALEEQGGTEAEINKRVNESLDYKRKVLAITLEQTKKETEALGKKVGVEEGELSSQRALLNVAEARLKAFDKQAEAERTRIANIKEESNLTKTLSNIRSADEGKLKELSKIGVAEAKIELERRKKEKKAIKEKEKEEEKLAKDKVKAEEALLKKILKLQDEAALLEIDDKKELELTKLDIAFAARKKDITDSIADQKTKDEALSQLKKNRLLEDKKLEAEFKKDKEEKDKEAADKEKEDRAVRRDFIVTQAAELANELTSLVSARTDRERNIELANLDAQLQQGLISQEQFESKKLEIEKKAFEKKKKLELANIAIALATEIASINAAAAGNPANAFTFGGAGISQAAVLTGVAVAKSAIQAAAVSSQQFEDGGVLSGPSHANGGIPFTVGGVGGFEAEGGEAIINKRSTAMFKPLLSAINQAGGGTSFASPSITGGFFRDGGVTQPTSIDTAGLEQRMTQAVINSIGSIPVINNATDTIAQAAKVSNIEQEASFG